VVASLGRALDREPLGNQSAATGVALS